MQKSGCVATVLVNGRRLESDPLCASLQEYNRHIRAQQDAEYEASLAADQARAAQIASAREEEERVVRMQAEQEAAEKAAADAAASAAAERANALAARQAASAAALAPEPPPGPGAVQVCPVAATCACLPCA